MLNEVMGYIQDIWGRLSRLESKNVQLLQVRGNTTASKNTNVNPAAATAIDWNLGATSDIGNIGTLFTHSTSTNPTRITINRKAFVEVDIAICVSGAVTDTNVEVSARVNGSTFLRPFCNAYISNAGGHTLSNAIMTVWYRASAGDYIEVLTQQEAAAGTVALRDISRLTIKEIFQ